MVQILKRLCFLACVAGVVPMASGFALLGPVNEAYQVGNIGYNLTGDIGAPKNYAEEFRLNRPVMYYSCDDAFVNFFGPEGLSAIDSAFAILNQLTNVSSYSADLSDIPLESLRVNYQAQALSLLDIKSLTLTALVERMGLAEPERWVWCLHNRYLRPNTQCPEGEEYDVIKRNFDPVLTGPTQVQYSSFVNGNLFSYGIAEACTGPDPLADAVEFVVDPLANAFSAVASYGWSYGTFYLGLTRDDVGGLRYLLRTNNYNIEAAGAETVAYITNTTPQLLFTSNLFQFYLTTLTNDPGTLATLYPNLAIVNSWPFFTNVVTTTTVYYFTNEPFAPYGTAALRSADVLTTNPVVYYVHQFANAFVTPSYPIISNTQVPLVTGHSSSNALWTFWQTNVSTSACGPGSTYGQICTNTSPTNAILSGFYGDYFILPSNMCSVALVSTQLIIAVVVTNQTLVASNAPGTTNADVVSFSQTPTYSFNQYVYVIRPVVCPTNPVAMRQGIERVQYVRRDFDSLLGRFFYPATNRYTMMILTNNSLFPQLIERVVTTPDYLMMAMDTSPGPGANAGPGSIGRDTPAYDAANINPNLAGPGVIPPGNVFTFNKVGPIYHNSAPSFLDEATQTLFFIWGSFDGTTNAPIVFPSGTSLQNLENQLLIELTPSGPNLTNGQVGQAYAQTITVAGGTAPRVWSLSGAGLPPGLALTVVNAYTVQITGTPTLAGVYDFSLQVVDATSRLVVRPYSITVTP